jgi:hypothetical protein
LPIFAIDLSKAQLSRIGRESTKKKFAFQLTLGERKFYFITTDSRDLDGWTVALSLPPPSAEARAASTALLFPHQKSYQDQLQSSIRAAVSKFKSRKITSFFTSMRERAGSLAKKPAPLIFGGMLADHVPSAGSLSGSDEADLIPLVVRTCVEEIERRGVESQGLYRLSGNSATIQRLKQQFTHRKGGGRG